MEGHSGVTELENVVRVLDVVANLISNDTSRVDEPKGRMVSERKVAARIYAPCGGQVALLVDRARVTSDVVEPVLYTVTTQNVDDVAARCSLVNIEAIGLIGNDLEEVGLFVWPNMQHF